MAICTTICTKCNKREAFKQYKLCSICANQALDQFCGELEFAEAFKNALETQTGLQFSECIEMTGGMTVLGSKDTIVALSANEYFPTRDLDFDEDYGWSVIIFNIQS